MEATLRSPYFFSPTITPANPPFSCFRSFLAWILEARKQFIIIGNKNAITYKEVFPLLKENKIWIGMTPMSKDLLFRVPDSYAKEMLKTGKVGSSYRIVDGVVMGRSQSIWFTNVDHGKRHKTMLLDTMEHNLKFNKKLRKKLEADYGVVEYQTFDNYDAIEVPFSECIPSDYAGIMGVPITFMDKYCPEQFEIIGLDRYTVPKEFLVGGRVAINGKSCYARILIRHKKGVTA